MDIRVTGKQMDVGDALRTHVRDKLENIDNKYFNRAFGIQVTFAPEGQAFVKAHINLQVGRDISVTAHETAPDAYRAFDIAADRVAKQLRRYKKRLRDHHEKKEHTPEAEMTKARDYILATTELDHAVEEHNDEAAHDEPLIIAETAATIQKLTVADASMRLDLSGQCAILFRNPKTNVLNMLYKRTDGNIGWVEPSESQATAPVQKQSSKSAPTFKNSSSKKPSAKKAPSKKSSSKASGKKSSGKKAAAKSSSKKTGAKKTVKAASKKAASRAGNKSVSKKSAGKKSARRR